MGEPAQQTGHSVLIVGAGIAGLATAVALSRKGHKATLLESHPKLNEFGASIGITPNGVKVLKALGLGSEFDKIVTKNRYFDIRDGYTNLSLGKSPFNIKNYTNTEYGDECWSINRKDYQDALAAAAEKHGATILSGARVAPSGIDVENCTVELEGGKVLKADLIIGADGMKSAVRRSIPALAKVEPVPLEEQCFRCTIPKSAMRDNPKLASLLTCGDELGWTGPGKYILSWPMPDNRDYDVVTCVQGPSDVPTGKWGVKAEPDEARKDFQDFCPEAVELLSHIDGCIKWTLAELPPMETCRSENGKVVLIGDAFHAMIPHSASGGNSAIEDAACISECVDWAFKTGRNLSEATKAFEDLRTPRVRRMQTASQEGYDFLGAKGDFLPIRNEMLAAGTQASEEYLKLDESVRENAPKEKPDMNARFPTEQYLRWLYGHDTVPATKEHLATLG